MKRFLMSFSLFFLLGTANVCFAKELCGTLIASGGGGGALVGTSIGKVQVVALNAGVENGVSGNFGQQMCVNGTVYEVPTMGIDRGSSTIAERKMFFAYEIRGN